ncbi:MAG: signal peptidase I [Eubacterium sp.]|nr:signal peptidase I [Eubacterium sp.]
MTDKDSRIPELSDIPSIALLREELAREEALHSIRKKFWNIVVILIVAAAVTAVISTRLLVLVRINGNSMDPTLKDEEVVFLRQTKEIETGDVIGFYYGGKILLKRVIGVAGDQIEIDKEGKVSVNGRIIEEPYLSETNLGKCDIEFPYKVPQEMFFVLGDNRAVSIDSRTRTIGCVELDQVVGKVVLRAWPLGRMEMMR